MYSIDASSAQLILEYEDIFSNDRPDVEGEISSLNMHKSISVICELIRVRDVMLEPISTIGGEFRIPLETVLKNKICGIELKSSEKMFSNPLFRKDTHIITVQMLLILLKRVIQFGNYETLEDIDYEVAESDYKKIIQLQLAIASEVSQSHSKEFDSNHFLYSTYHLNYQRNVAQEFLRMYYMMEKISRGKNEFDADVRGEYRDYYTAFTEKYGFTPIEYSSLLFGELTTYYSDVNGLIYTSMWRELGKVYGRIKKKELIPKIISTLSQTADKYLEWSKKSKNQEWDFSAFFAFPFIMDGNGRYISVCDITLRNAFFEKVFWLIRDCYPTTDSRAMAFFGRLFEDYIQSVTQEATKGDYKYIAEFAYKFKKEEKKSSDAYIRKDTNLLVIEAKGFSVLLNCMTQNKQMKKNNTKLFVEPVIQADLCLATVMEEKSEFFEIENAYIISVTMDNINAVPDFYNEIHGDIEKRKVCAKTKYYYNFNIEEYEMLMYLLEQQQQDIFSLLKDYYDNDNLVPFSNYLKEKHHEIGMTTFMKTLYKEAAEKMKEMLFQSKG